MSTIFFTTILQKKTLNSRLLRAVIDSKKIILAVCSNRKQEVIQHLRFGMKNIVNAVFLKEKRKERKQSTQKIHNIFHNS